MPAFFVSWHPHLWIWKRMLCYNSTQHQHKTARCKEGSGSFKSKGRMQFHSLYWYCQGQDWVYKEY